MGNLPTQMKKTLEGVPARMTDQQRDMMLKQRELQMAMNLAGAKVRRCHSDTL